MDNKQKLAEILQNKDFVVEMMSQETPEDVQKVFAQNGVDISLEEVNQLGKALADIENGDLTEEITEESLENVAGGSLTAAAIAWGIVKVVGAAGALGVSVYKWYKSR